MQQNCLPITKLGVMKRSYEMKVKTVAVLMILLHACVVHADGWSNLSGKNTQGAEIIVGPSQLTDDDYVPNPKGPGFVPKPESYSYYDVFVSLGQKVETYERQKCDFVERSGVRVTFSCSSSGSSPLAGTTYKIIPNPKNDCSYESKFVCVKGCVNASTPKTMLKDWWECGM